MSDRPIRILVDVPVEPAALAALRDSGRFEVDCMETPAETVRAIAPARLKDIESLFCTFPPSNLHDMPALRWIQIASAGYSQLFGLDLAARGVRATNARDASTSPSANGAWP